MEIHNANIIVQTDGDFRDGKCAAASWIIGLWGDDGGGFKHEPLVAHGTYLDAACGVFTAEAIALDEASAEVDRLIRASQTTTSQQ